MIVDVRYPMWFERTGILWVICRTYDGASLWRVEPSAGAHSLGGTKTHVIAGT